MGKKPGPKKKKKHNLKPEVKRVISWSVILVTFGVIILSLANQAGIVGEGVNYALDQTLGVGKFVVPILFVLTLIIYYTPDVLTRFIRWICLYGVFVFGLGFLTLFQRHDISVTPDHTGGLLGSVMQVIFESLFGFIGGVIVLAVVSLIFLLVGLNHSLRLERSADVGKTFLEQVQSFFQEIQKSRSHRAEVKQKQRAEKPKKTSSESSSERMFKDRAQKHDFPQANALNEKSQQEKDESQDPESQEPESQEPSSQSKSPSWMKEENFVLPSFDILEPEEENTTADSGDQQRNIEIIRNTLSTFGIEVEMGDVDVGPTVTRYMLRPSNGVKLSRITALQSDLALALAAQAIRIEAPIPGMSYVGIEIPNEKRAVLRLHNILKDANIDPHETHLPLALGRNVMNETIVAPLEKMPHLLIAGATGAGKSMGLNAMIVSMLYHNPPSRLKFVFIDPKRVELSTYNGIPHLLTPAISQPEKAMNALNWCVSEMERRYEILSQSGSKNIFTYNQKIQEDNQKASQEEQQEIMPFIVVVIDELADLMTTHKKDVEGAIVRIAQMARAVGIHLILATQRPSTDVITGLIKANLPSRISFQVASQIDSRTVLDMMGAEKLLGKGDMIFLGGDLGRPQRIQGPLVPEEEVKSVVEWLKNQREEVIYNDTITSADVSDKLTQPGGSGGESEDPLFDQAKELVIQTNKGSASLIQRRLKVGYSRAARLLDELEDAGVVGPAEGSKPRDVYGEPAE